MQFNKKYAYLIIEKQTIYNLFSELYKLINNQLIIN